MSSGRPRHRAKPARLANFIGQETSKTKITELSTDAINVLELACLIVDIEYRHKFKSEVPERGYNNVMNVLADQLPPVDNRGSARHTSTGDNCNEA